MGLENTSGTRNILGSPDPSTHSFLGDWRGGGDVENNEGEGGGDEEDEESFEGNGVGEGMMGKMRRVMLRR